MKHVVVIFYEGRPLDTEVSLDVIRAIAPVLEEGHSQPVLKVMTEDQVFAEIAKAASPQPIVFNNEEGDNAVKVIMNMIPVSLHDNLAMFQIHLIRLIAAAEHGNSYEDHALMSAVAYVYNNAAISDETRRRYNFTTAHDDIVKQVYKNYLQYR